MDWYKPQAAAQRYVRARTVYLAVLVLVLLAFALGVGAGLIIAAVL
jgi:hypothetical protein